MNFGQEAVPLLPVAVTTWISNEAEWLQQQMLKIFLELSISSAQTVSTMFSMRIMSFHDGEEQEENKA